jgi:5-methylcytosine-specific restriction endonuclease McrA
MDDPLKTKICSKCPEKGPQPRTAFHKHRGRKDGYNSICKACNAQYYATHLPQIRNRRKAYYAAHREEELASNGRWRKDNPDAYLAAVQRWIAEHPKQHKALKRKASRVREARKKTVQIEDIDEAAIYARDRGICQLCHKPVSLKWESPDPRSKSLDHVIPLSEGGPHTMQNLVLFHRGCNSRKGNRHRIPQQQRLFG